MRSYKTLSEINAIAGALRAFDLLGQLPLRDPAIPSSEELQDFVALADDWQAVAEDLWDAVRLALQDSMIIEALEQSERGDLARLSQRLDEIADAARRQRHEVDDLQLSLFHSRADDEGG
ncbi:MAG: hypothetical protein ACLF0P_13485 [Thermoanaerobaculia bacterium]